MRPVKSYFIFSKKERWGLTVWGWLLILLAVISFVFLIFFHLFPTLTPTSREKTDILVLEGASSDYVLDTAIIEFRKGHYNLLITTGTPLEWGHLLSQYDNTGKLAAASLIKMGFDSTKLVAVSTNEIRNDRTYNSAIALKHWLKKNRPNTKAINLMSLSVHGARSQRLFQYALGDTIRVGIISVKNFYYGGRDWYKSSKGVRETMNEAIGYVYVRFFFHPYEKEIEIK